MRRKRATTLDADEPLSIRFGSLLNHIQQTPEQEMEQARAAWIELHVKNGIEPPKMQEQPKGPSIDDEFDRLLAEAMQDDPMNFMNGFVKYLFFTRFYQIEIESLSNAQREEFERTRQHYEKFKSFLRTQSGKLQLELHTLAIETQKKPLISFLAHLGESPLAKIEPGIGEWQASLRNPRFDKPVGLSKQHANMVRVVHCFYFLERYIISALDTIFANAIQVDAEQTWNSVMQGCTHVQDWNHESIDLLIRLRAVVEIVRGWC